MNQYDFVLRSALELNAYALDRVAEDAMSHWEYGHQIDDGLASSPEQVS